MTTTPTFSFPDPDALLAACMAKCEQNDRLSNLPATDLALAIHVTVTETLAQLRPVFLGVIDQAREAATS